MKLLNYTSKYLAIILLVLISVWAVLFYYAMMDEIYDSLDDGLENQKILMVQRAAEDPTILEQDDPEFKKHVYNFTSISKKTYQGFKESYRDTSMYMLNEKDYEPVRVFESSVANGKEYYKLKIITSMVEEDDLAQDLILYLVGLYLLLIASILLLNNLLLRKIWHPFYLLIEQLREFSLEKNTQLKIPKSNIEEFSLLNTTVDKLIKKSSDTYIAQKHFIENASHELQTPLAISINKLELFLENNELNESQLKDIATVLDNLGKLTRMNKSLLLLSKIENRQFDDEESVDFISLTKHIVADFEDLAMHKEVSIRVLSKDALKFKMNEDLAIILLINLIKNAIIHSQKNENIYINIQSDTWQIKNSRGTESLDQISIFKRFIKDSNDNKSSGLGLPISKAIADRYDLDLSYHFNDSHVFLLEFPVKS